MVGEHSESYWVVFVGYHPGIYNKDMQSAQIKYKASDGASTFASDGKISLIVILFLGFVACVLSNDLL